jgi:hypothetical protein
MLAALRGQASDSISDLTHAQGSLSAAGKMMGDNGASAEGTLQVTTSEVGTAANGVKESIPFLLSMSDELGGPRTYNHYPVGWAHAMDSPMQWTKQIASHFGGSSNGMVISWPARIKEKGGLRSQFCYVIDIVPTIYEAAYSAGYVGRCEAETNRRRESRLHLRQRHDANAARHPIFRDAGYDYTFLAPCPTSGLLINGDKDRVVPSNSVTELVAKTKIQKGIKIEHTIVAGANHFFQDKIEELTQIVGAYVDRRMGEIDKARKEKEPVLRL